MLSLKISKELFEIDLADSRSKLADGSFEVTGPDIILTCRPASSMDFAIADAHAQNVIGELEESQKTCLMAGVMQRDAALDLDDPVSRSAAFRIEKVKKLASMLITGWTNVTDQSNLPAPINEKTTAALMEIYPLGERFYHRLCQTQIGMLSAKKESGATSPGTIKQEAAPRIAETAMIKEAPAPKAKRGWMGKGVPMSKTAPKPKKK